MHLSLKLFTVATVLFAATDSVRANYVVNGGFETGDFTGWTLIGDPSQTAVDTGHPHNGIYNAQFGQTGEVSTLSQPINTTVGTSYTLSFWFSGSGDNPSEFKASVGDTVLLDLVNPPLYDLYQQYTYKFTATVTSTDIKFQGRDDVFFMQLDDVSVVPASIVPEPTSIISLGIGLTFASAYCLCRGRRSR